MTARERPPNRRAAIASDFDHGGLAYHAHVGFSPQGELAELFLNATKQNSMADALASDGAILISLLLQRGSSVAEIGHALRRNSDGSPASVIGAAADHLLDLEAGR